MKKSVKETVKAMTLEEKAALCSGANYWETEVCERLGIGKIVHADGPYGLRKEEQDGIGAYKFNHNLPSICYPASVTAASSFDIELIEEEGKLLGKQCRSEGVDVLLGPGVNIKRSPLCGRNFEYYSEDPYLSSRLGAAYIKGVQSQNVGTSLKHFFANNQETSRMSISSEVDERTLHEIYLSAFEYAVKEGKPWTVMASYNKVNGVYATEYKQYLDMLRNEWGFDGYVVSDWGATHNRVRALEGGTALTMPCATETDSEIVLAVKEGRLSESVLDTACEQILNILERAEKNRESKVKFDLEEGHAFARKMAEEGAVLLKNEGVLPLKKSSKVAFIGYFANTPRIMGNGSSCINAFRIDSAIEAAKGYKVQYAQGYRCDDSYAQENASDGVDKILENEAIQLAKDSDVAVIFAGIPDMWESEGYDRPTMKMPECQNILIEKICAVQKNTVVVLHNGSPIEMPWADKVPAILEMYLGGQAVGSATVNLLYGKVNPSGRLAETFPVKLEDNPSYLFYLGENDKTAYNEGVFVGYRYYTKKKMQTLFPFGHGLSYTKFEYSDLTVDKTQLKSSENIKVSVKVKNTGKVEGKEVVQLYISADTKGVIRPVRELKAFKKLSLAVGEEKTVEFILSERDYAYWNSAIHAFHVATGNYSIEICRNADEVILSQTVKIEGVELFSEKFTMNTTLIKLIKTEKGMKYWQQTAMTVVKFFKETTPGSENMTDEEGYQSMMQLDNPLLQMDIGTLCNLFGDPAMLAKAQTLVNDLNEEYGFN